MRHRSSKTAARHCEKVVVDIGDDTVDIALGDDIVGVDRLLVALQEGHVFPQCDGTLRHLLL